MKKAFTLIELLVVVLIIGILAAIALPQYQKAVAKSRFAAVTPRVHALEQSLREYYLTNGYFKLDYDAFAVGEKLSSTGCASGGAFCQTDIGSEMKVEILNGSGISGPAQFYQVYCMANASNSQANSICSEYGEYKKDNSGYKYYLMKTVNGNGEVTYHGRTVPL